MCQPLHGLLERRQGSFLPCISTTSQQFTKIIRQDGGELNSFITRFGVAGLSDTRRVEDKNAEDPSIIWHKKRLSFNLVSVLLRQEVGIWDYQTVWVSVCVRIPHFQYWTTWQIFRKLEPYASSGHTQSRNYCKGFWRWYKTLRTTGLWTLSIVRYSKN
jgi:hypothetical protein